jgi:hypothetical protein
MADFYTIPFGYASYEKDKFVLCHVCSYTGGTLMGSGEERRNVSSNLV